MDKSAAAARLGVPEAEVLDVLVDDAGVVIVTFDRQTYIDVPADRPDADGKTGLMFLAAPTETYGGDFPVFAQPEPIKDAEPQGGQPADVDKGGGPERVTEVIPAPSAGQSTGAFGAFLEAVAAQQAAEAAAGNLAGAEQQLADAQAAVVAVSSSEAGDAAGGGDAEASPDETEPGETPSTSAGDAPPLGEPEA